MNLSIIFLLFATVIVAIAAELSTADSRNATSTPAEDKAWQRYKVSIKLISFS